MSGLSISHSPKKNLDFFFLPIRSYFINFRSYFKKYITIKNKVLLYFYFFLIGCLINFQVKCTENSACSRNPVTVMITDSCPGCAPIQFDLSGTAFGSLANNGQANNLRNAGRINVQYQRYLLIIIYVWV